MNADLGWQPATSGERYQTIDILRGLALFGVLAVNMLTIFRVPLLEHILRRHTYPVWANHLVDLLVAGALEFKAVTIFSFLFGVGIAMQAEKGCILERQRQELSYSKAGLAFHPGYGSFCFWSGMGTS